MTALERNWVESEWEYLFDLFPMQRRRAELDLETASVYVGEWYGMLSADDLHVVGPCVRSSHEARADAEAMYRQWVYDEYGVVLG